MKESSVDAWVFWLVALVGMGVLYAAYRWAQNRRNRRYIDHIVSEAMGKSVRVHMVDAETIDEMDIGSDGSVVGTWIARQNIGHDRHTGFFAHWDARGTKQGRVSQHILVVSDRVYYNKQAFVFGSALTRQPLRAYDSSIGLEVHGTFPAGPLPQ